MIRFTESVLVVNGISAAADLFNGNPTSDVISLENFEKAVFILQSKSSTGTANIKVQAVSSAAGSDAENVPFYWSKKTTGGSDVWTAPALAVAADGIATIAGEDTIHVIEVDGRQLPDDMKYVQLKLTEVVNDPVAGGLTILLMNGRYGSPFPVAIVE